MPAPPGWAIETSGLVKVYKEGGIRAVDGLDLKVEAGEVYALIGANGSGKTTTVNMLTGVLTPTAGSIKVLGMEMPRERHEMAKQMGIVPQEYSLYSDLTVEQNIAFLARLYGVERREFESRLGELLSILGLGTRRKAVVSSLSGGMKRRVSIACSLIHDPKLVFFDEATVGIDPVLRAYFWKYFRSLADKGTTIVLTSHAMDEAERADRVGLMRAGKLIEEGTPADLKKKHDASSIEDVFLRLSGGVAADE